VGKATLGDLAILEIDSVEKLALQDATFLFCELERRTKQRQDPCVWDVFAAIIHEAATGCASDWWEWTKVRKNLQKSGSFNLHSLSQ
jgi:hypothetical protein